MVYRVVARHGITRFQFRKCLHQVQRDQFLAQSAKVTEQRHIGSQRQMRKIYFQELGIAAAKSRRWRYGAVGSDPAGGRN